MRRLAPLLVAAGAIAGSVWWTVGQDPTDTPRPDPSPSITQSREAGDAGSCTDEVPAPEVVATDGIALPVPAGWTMRDSSACATGTSIALFGDASDPWITIRTGEADRQLEHACDPPEEGSHRACRRVRLDGATWVRRVYVYDVLSLDYLTIHRGRFIRLIASIDLGDDERVRLAEAEELLRAVRLV